MPKWTRRPEVESLRNRSTIWQRKQAQLCHTSQRSSTGSTTWRSQSRLYMGPVGLEQNGLHHGLAAGQRRHRSDPSRENEEAEITRRPLKENCSSIARKVEKVKGHQRRRNGKRSQLKKQERRSGQESSGSSSQSLHHRVSCLREGRMSSKSEERFRQ